MARKLECLLALMMMVAPACAAAPPGSISGFVRDSNGVPQMGVAVEIISPQGPLGATVFTDARGFYRASGLAAGAYQVKASAASYLPSLRENIALRAGANLIVNLTLTTLFEAAQWLPPPRTSPQQDDDWKWTLRTATSRPILRLFDDDVPSAKNPDRNLKAEVSFIAGTDNDGFGGAADMTTQFRIDQSLFSAGTLSLGGNLGYGSGTAAGVVRAGYSQEMADGSRPEMALTVRHFALPETMQHDAALDAMALSVADGITLADLIDLHVGGALEAIDFRGDVTAFRPFGTAAVHVSPNTVVLYTYATSEPNTRMAKGFDTAPADLTESGPRVSLHEDRALLEHAQHQEIAVSHRMGNTSVQAAAYYDHLQNVALVGVGEVSGNSGEFLPDVYSGTFTYNGGELATEGVRAVAQRKLLSDLTATVDYSYGGVIAPPGSGVSWEAGSSLHVERRHAAALKLAGGVPHCKTQWIASYKWTSGSALTPVDMFNASPGESDPYLNIFLRQPLPVSFLTGHMEALLDLHNLLAQGYVPVLGLDGQTLYLVQSARSVRGGLAFTF